MIPRIENTIYIIDKSDMKGKKKEIQKIEDLKNQLESTLQKLKEKEK